MSDDILNEKSELQGVLHQVSEQLKYSLGNIHSALERIAPAQARDDSPQLDRDAAVLCQSYYRILRLANNLSDATHLDSDPCLRLRSGDIVDLCADVMARAALPAQLLELELEFICKKPSHIIAMSADHLERLLLNLLSNAFKFTPKGGKITLEVRIESQTVELRLSDTGQGIPPERMENIFDRYLAARKMDTLPYGLGLGLPICRRIARAHGGSIFLTSREGEGTTVVVSLPNKRSHIQELNAFVIDYAGGFNRTLVELSDALPRQAFVQKYLD